MKNNRDDSPEQLMQSVMPRLIEAHFGSKCKRDLDEAENVNRNIYPDFHNRNTSCCQESKAFASNWFSSLSVYWQVVPSKSFDLTTSSHTYYLSNGCCSVSHVQYQIEVLESKLDTESPSPLAKCDSWEAKLLRSRTVCQSLLAGAPCIA